MPRTQKTTSAASQVRVLLPSEYPEEITARRGMFTPDVRFAAIDPLGLYWVDHEGAGHLGVYFRAKRKGSRARTIGGAQSLRGALERISDHEDRLLNPEAAREEGRRGPVSIYELGRRTGEKKTPTELDRMIEVVLLHAS